MRSDVQAAYLLGLLALSVFTAYRRMSSDALRSHRRQKGPPTDKREHLEEQGCVRLQQDVPASAYSISANRRPKSDQAVVTARASYLFMIRELCLLEVVHVRAGLQVRLNRARSAGRHSGCRSTGHGQMSCPFGSSCAGTSTLARRRVAPSLRTGPAARRGVRKSGQRTSPTPSRSWPCGTD